MSGAYPPDIFDHVRESIVVRTLDGKILTWNAESEALYGWSASDAVGARIDDLLETRSDETPKQISDALTETGRWEGQLRRRTAKGVELVIGAKLSARRGADGAPIEVFETCKDLTSQLKADRALKAAERRYMNLFQAMAASFWELDFNGVGAMLRHLRKQGVGNYADYFDAHPAFVREMMRATQIIDVNDETVRLFAGGDRSALEGSIEPYWPEATGDVYAASVVAAVSGAPSYSLETRLRRADGTEFEALFTACFPAESVARGTLLIGVIDISERKRAQRAEQQLREEFAHAARISMLGELTASIAHEVNQPLAAITTNGSASLRWLDRATPDVERVSRLTRNIVDDAQRAAEIILRIRKLAAKQPTLFQPLSVQSVLDEAAEFLKHELQGNGVTLAIQGPSDLPLVNADRTQLQQVFANLLINASHAMAQHGSAHRRIDVSARVANEQIAVVVQDTGPGIPADQLPRLFDSFFTTKEDGLGMGLSICRTILDQHSGTITADNNDSGGAIFTVTIPLADAAPTSAQGR